MNIPYRYTEKRVGESYKDFGGLDRRRKGPDESFRDMTNMSGDQYKSIVSRRPRGIIPFEGEKITAMVTTDVLIDGKIVENAFIMNVDNYLTAYYKKDGKLREEFLMKAAGLTTGENTVITAGGYMYLFPDKKYINLMNTSDFGSLDKKIDLVCGAVTENGQKFWYEAVFEKCDAEGNAKTDGAYIKLYKTKYYYYDSTGRGNKLSSPAIAYGFYAGDMVKISGSGNGDGYRRVVYIPPNETFFVLDGGNSVTLTAGTVRVSRDVPDMDYVVASGNRLWGCRYGVNSEGMPVNEIYASALGDAKNWYKFQGVSTDSYTASIGVDGVFTGACEYQGNPMFFKEDAVIRVYGDRPSNYSVTSVNIRGIEKGSAASVVNVSNNLIYKSHSGFVAYNAGNPVNIDDALGDAKYINAVAGMLCGKYYVSAEREDGKSELLVFDTAARMWHKEDDLRVKAFSRASSELYMLCSDNRLLSVCGSGEIAEDCVSWSFVTGEIGSKRIGIRAVTEVCARLEMPYDGRLSIEIEYDESGKWQRVATYKGRGSVADIRIKPRRCHTFRLRFSGEGEFSLYSMSAAETECVPIRGIK